MRSLFLNSYAFAAVFLLSALLPGVLGSNETCLIPDCIKATAHILQKLNPDYKSMDPCNDFEQYVCGGYPALWPDEPDMDPLTSIQTSNKYVLQRILESPYPGTNSTSSADDKTAFDMVVRNYNSCMNATAINNTDQDRIMQIAKRVTELFPADVTDFSSNTTLTDQDLDALADAVAYLSQNGVPVFGEFWTGSDPQIPAVLVPSFGPNIFKESPHALPAFTGLRELLSVPEEDLVAGLANLLPDVPNSSFVGTVRRVLVLADSYAQLDDSVLSGTTDLYFTTTVEEADKMAPALTLGKVIQKLAPADYELDRMIFQFPALYSNLSDVVATTPKPTLQALMLLLAWQSYEPFLTATDLPSPTVTRWDTCYQYVDRSLPWIASKFFLDEAYTEEVREELKKMTDDIEAAFLRRVAGFDWISNSTKTLVLDKLQKVTDFIGYPERVPSAHNATSLLSYYSPINITDSYFDNALSIRQWAVTRAFDALSRPYDSTLWEEGDHSYISNAEYIPNTNNFYIPAGITQPPLFYPGAPSYLRYGSLGIIIGHEITHGFDTQGRLWNNNKQFKESWDNSSTAAFNTRAQCFIDQFNAIPLVDYTGTPVLNETGGQAYVNGTIAITENIADAGGVSNAWAAWQAREAADPSPRLPGLDEFSKEQLFFIASGQTWCSKFSADTLLTLTTTDPHAPDFARAGSIAENSKGFRETWGCPVKEGACELW